MVKKAKKTRSPSFSSDDGSDFSFDNKDGFATMENEVFLDDSDDDQQGFTKQKKEESPEDLAAQKKAQEERKKAKKIEQLDKKIKKLVKNQQKEKPINRVAAEIKNKLKRQEIVVRKKLAAKDEKIIERLKKKKVREEQGEGAMPKGETKTIESMRVADETLITQEDEEIKGEQEIDEFSTYFKNQTQPRILMTTNRRPKGGIFDFLKELKDAIPNTEYYERGNMRVKEIIQGAIKRGFTDLLLFYEKHGNPHTLILSHLPDGPTATFRVSGVKLRRDIYNYGNPTSHNPELILNNFDTIIGHRIGRMLAALFPQSPNFHGRRVITFHNQRDFVFFRQHRYEFNEDGSRANLQETGPRFTLKLHSLQLGTLDSKYGEFEFIYKPRMGTNRKKMFL